MKLATYLAEKPETAAAFARRANPPISRSAICRLLNGSRTPSLGLAYQIKRMTGGKVDLPDWKAQRKPEVAAAAP